MTTKTAKGSGPRHQPAILLHIKRSATPLFNLVKSMNHINFIITQSSIDNGRLYFEGVPSGFFPLDAMGGRGADEHAPSKVNIVAGADSVDTDIRKSSAVRLSPRSSFKHWLRSVRAVAGGTAQIVRTADRSYSLQYKG